MNVVSASSLCLTVRVKLPEADDTKIGILLDSKIDQRKQLGTFGSVKHVDRLEIVFLNQIGIAHLESVGKQGVPHSKATRSGFRFRFRRKPSDSRQPLPNRSRF